MNTEIANAHQSKSPRQRESTQKRRREILDAALKCFLKNGVSRTTIEQIRIKSGASAGSIYHLFSGKDEIALTLFVEGMQKYHRKIMHALENETTSRGSIRAIVATHLKDNVDESARSLFETRMGMADDVGEISQQYRLLNDEFAQAIWQHLKPFVDRGELVQLRPELYFSLIVGPASHLARSWLRGRVAFDLMSATDEMAEAAWKSLCKQ